MNDFEDVVNHAKGLGLSQFDGYKLRDFIQEAVKLHPECKVALDTSLVFDGGKRKKKLTLVIEVDQN